MAVLRTLLTALLVLSGSMAAAADDSQTQSAVDPSTVEWTAERYLGARPMEPLPVRSLSRDPQSSGLLAAPAGAPVESLGRPPLRGRLDFDLYIHDPGAQPRYLTSRRRPQSGEQAVKSPVVGPFGNRGRSAMDFTSSRLLPRDARVVYPYSAVGKLFFVKPGGGSGYCSASVIEHRVVVTAGHCVYTPGEGWHKNFSYVPAYYQGNAPFGTWRASRIWTTNTWFKGDNDYPNAADFGVLVMRDNTLGERLGEVTGWLGWRTKSLTPNHLHILGYPSNLDKGTEMHQVTSGSYDCCFTNTAIYGTDMRQGSSGGPWVQNFGVRAKGQRGGKKRRLNRVVGVYSWLYTSDKKIMIAGSSIPGASFSNMVQEACDNASGNCSG